MKKIIILILILAAILRLVGIYPGYHPNHADEVNIYSTTISMFKADNLEPYRYEYPPLASYINLFLFKTVFIPITTARYYLSNTSKVLDGVLPIHMTPLAYNRFLQLEIFGDREINTMFWVRTVTAIFGVGVVFFIYKIGQQLFDLKVGLIAAFLVAINFRQVLNSHFGLPDIYNAFFLVLSFWFVIRVWKKPTFKNYILAALACGLSFATKYQFFSFIPFFLVHMFRVFEKKEFKDKVRTLFDPAAIVVPFVIALVFLIFNAYFFINFDIARNELTTAAMKYRIGKNSLDFYPIFYLYHYGIGKLTSSLIILGIPLIFFKGVKKALLVFSVVMPFMFFTIYYTGGGFYTRNFVTITPFLVIFPAIVLGKILEIKFKYVAFFIFALLITIASWENLNKDFIVLANYTKAWHKDVFMDWVKNAIPKGSKIAAHSSVPLPDYYFERLEYDLYPAFSLEELKKKGATYAVTSFDWATNDFYWWMTQDTKQSLKYWEKPTSVMEETYVALSIRELQDFGMYGLFSSPYAPDSDFLAVHLPIYIVFSKILTKDYTFEKDTDGWTKEGSNNLLWKDGQLIIDKGGVSDPFIRWESPVTEVNASGFEVDYKMKTDEVEGGGLLREGFLLASFYGNLADANAGKNRLGVRLTARNDIYNKWIDGTLVGEVPTGAHYVRIGLQVYNAAVATVYLDEVKIFDAEVKNRIVDTKHIDIDPDIVFPISHGNL